MNGTSNKDTLDELEDYSIFAWIENNDIKTETGERLNFNDYRFLLDIYGDNSNLLCCMKAAQIGFSTYEILKTAYECRNDGLDIIYVLPSDDDVQRFSGGKTNKIIAQNAVLQSWTKDKDSVYQKQFGAHSVYYEGAWTERAALSTTAKKLVVDEYDRCKPEIVEQYDSRLQSVANPKKAFFSNPSLPNIGVNLYYLQSDQKKWHITHSCGKTFPFEENCIDYDQELFICPHCKNEITDEERKRGKWIATAQGKWSGYWIPLWIAPWMKASNIAEFKRTKSPQYFANFVAGLPYIGGEDTISSAQVLKNCVDEVNTQEDRIIIGVDPGNPWYFVCMNKQGVFYAEEMEKAGVLVNGKPFNPIDRIRELLNMWKTAIVVMDQGGEQSPQRILKEEFKGRVFLAFYQKDTKSFEVVRWGEGDKWGEVRIDRNKMFQIMVEQLRDVGRVRFNGTKDDWLPVAEHFDHVYREVVITTSAPGKDDRGLYTPEYVWKRNGDDHFCHCLLYSMVGLDRWANDKALIVKKETAFRPPTGSTITNQISAKRIMKRLYKDAEFS